MKAKGKTLSKILLLASLLIGAGPLFANGVFTVDITSLDESFSEQYANAEEVFDQLDEQQLNDAFTNYIDTSPVDANIDFRGLEMLLGFAQGSNDLVFNVPSLQINETFIGITRDESIDNFVDYLKGAEFNTINDIQKELARVSPVDPVAGNPSSLMAGMVSYDFAN